MRRNLFSIGTLRIATLVVGLLSAGVAHADTSTSFTLIPSLPDSATVNTTVSTSFQVQEGHTGWYESPLGSTNFQIVPPSGSYAVTSSSTSSSSSGGGGGSGGGGSSTSSSSQRGGTRRERPSSSASSSATSVQSSRSRSSSSEGIGHPAAPAEEGDQDAGSSSSLSSSIDRIGGEAGTKQGQWGTLSFFGVIRHCYTSPDFGPWLMILLLLTVTTFVAAVGVVIAHHRESKKRRSKMLKRRRALMIALGVAALISALLFGTTLAQAASTTPQTHVYNGRLLDSSGNAITTAHSIRFSYWTSADAVSGDITGTGAINTGSSTYAGWQEVHAVTPNASGYFSVKLGSITSMPDFSTLPTATLLSLYLQVEVKAAADADTAYEILDPDSTDTTIDRSGVLSVPFATNADMIDQREIGTGSGSIPILGSGGVLSESAIPGGTNSGTFIIDADSSESSTINLQFGRSLEKKLTYDIVNNLFKFNASLKVEGNLTVTGLINGIDLSSLTGLSDSLKASSGAGLTVNVFAGSYRLRGVVTNYAGGSTTMTDDATNYVFFGSGGLTVNTTGFPTDEAYIAVAEVTTSGGSISLITDRRVTASDDREKNRSLTFTPEFEKAAYQGDGADNTGQLSISHDNISLKNFYLWTSTRSTLQDYDLLLRVPVSDDFVRWTATGSVNPLSFNYRTTSADSANNALAIQVYDTNGTPVTLSGSTTNLAGTSWSTAQVEFTGSPTWTAGQDMLIRFKFYAKDAYQAQLGTLRLEFVDLRVQ